MTAQPVTFGDDGRGDDTSAERARTTPLMVRQISRVAYRVAYCDGDDAHETRLARDRNADEWLGWCDCKGWEYNDGPCAHLWALKYAAEWGLLDLPAVADALGNGGCPTCGSYPEGGRP